VLKAQARVDYVSFVVEAAGLNEISVCMYIVRTFGQLFINPFYLCDSVNDVKV